MCVILLARFRFYFRDGSVVVSRRTTVLCRSIAKFRLHDCVLAQSAAGLNGRCVHGVRTSYHVRSASSPNTQFSTSNAGRPLNEQTDGEDCVAGRFDHRKSDTCSRQTVSALPTCSPVKLAKPKRSFPIAERSAIRSARAVRSDSTGRPTTEPSRRAMADV